MSTIRFIKVFIYGIQVFFSLIFHVRWFDVMQKASNQLRSNIANATRHRGDKVRLKYPAFKTSVSLYFPLFIIFFLLKQVIQKQLH